MLRRHPALAALLVAAPIPAAHAQDAFDPLLHGALVYHGNYCGPGNKGVHPAPVDALDAACMRHDACVRDFTIPSCGCNSLLARDAGRVARDPRAPDGERRDAEFTAVGARMPPCR